MPGPAVYRTIADLPETIAVFPLPSAILLPRARLPLNIFEPRYLTMIDDALRGGRLIGMVQPMSGIDSETLYPVGCAGRISALRETDDRRYLIELTGVCRFRIEQELKVTTPYRQTHVTYTEFNDDLKQTDEAPSLDRSRLATALNAYLKDRNFDADWGAAEKAPTEILINSLSMHCPFAVSEKQALVEAKTIDERAVALLTLLEMAVAGGEASTDGGKSVQ
jgi:Lon protease-like protein